jgi:hypothetical protein
MSCRATQAAVGWSVTLTDQELMAERKILEGDSRPAEHDAEERPETDHDEHGANPGISMSA